MGFFFFKKKKKNSKSVLKDEKFHGKSHPTKKKKSERDERDPQYGKAKIY